MFVFQLKLEFFALFSCHIGEKLHSASLIFLDLPSLPVFIRYSLFLFRGKVGLIKFVGMESNSDNILDCCYSSYGNVCYLNDTWGLST